MKVKINRCEQLFSGKFLSFRKIFYTDAHGIDRHWEAVDRTGNSGCAHAVFIIARIVPDNEVVMIRQFRHGSGRIELEVPGGCIDRADSDPLEAAQRELLEETGFAGENPHIIGKVCPNPAIQHNTCYVVKIDNVRRVSEPQLEDTEDIEHLVVPQSKVREFLRSGAISHGIVLNALFFYLMDQCC